MSVHYCVVQFICYRSYMQLTILEWRPEPDAGAPLRRLPEERSRRRRREGAFGAGRGWGVAVLRAVREWECARAGARGA